MAIVDSLLKLVAVRGADALVVASGEVPCLTKGDADLPLSMPALGAEMIDTILGEVLAEPPPGSAAGPIRGSYRSPDGAAFEVVLRATEAGHRLTFRPDGHGQPGAEDRPGSHVAPPRGDRQSPAPVRPASPPTTTPYRAPTGDIADLLTRAESLDASDVLLSAGAPARARVAGELQSLEQGPLSTENILAFLEPWMSKTDQQVLDRDGSCDLTVQRPTSATVRRYRVNLFKQERGVAAALRPIKSQIPTLDELNLPADFTELTRHRSGLVLMVGTAGSGKSTTLVALIEHLNRTTAKHIITLEDPIEYSYTPQRCLIHQREVGAHVADFSTGLRAALRESPDVILLGEMRDRETIAATLTAAETGHLVLSTLHSGSAAMAIDRVIDVFPQHQQQQVRYQLADVLRAVVTQILLPSSGPTARVPAYERLVVTPAVSTKIRDQRCHQMETELQKGAAEGMVTLERSLARLVQRGALSLEVATAAAPDPRLLAQMVRGR